MSATPPTIPGLSTTQQRERAESLLATAYRSGMTDPKELANFMGQTQHESQNFTRLEENLNYRGSVLWDTFKGNSKTPPRNGLTEKEANDLASIPDRAERRMAIADKIYGGTWGERNLANTEEHDGHAYRGRGYIQLTGRGNYDHYSSSTGLDLINNPDLAALQNNAETLAVSYWNGNIQAKQGASTDVKMAGSIINTGKTYNTPKGLADRLANAAAWEAAIGKEGYLESVLERHPAEATQPPPAIEKEEALNQPLQLKPTHQLSPQSLQLIQQSEQQVRAIADRHQLPWNPGLDNTVHAVAQQAREQGLTGITHLKVQNGQIRFAQHDGYALREGQLDARSAANTDARASLTRMAQADQSPAQGSAFSATPARAAESPTMTV
ncbi:glycoside hydrolase family 19 protein [Hydrogenophaga sp. ZJX-1]|uniref:glycoside hydrolase family 19 protein n=1 Tax=Hydrogenophaga sp. ZJX-1 TaxID=3404778 RepID=UPI003B288DCF